MLLFTEPTANDFSSVAKKHAFYRRNLTLFKFHIGDVLVSKSGNYRLLINTFQSAGKTVFTFLSLYQGKHICIESTVKERIDSAKLQGVVRRIDCSPLINFLEELKDLSLEKGSIIYNLEVLLGSNNLGRIFNRILARSPKDIDGKSNIKMEIDNKGKFVKLSRNDSFSAVELSVSRVSPEVSDYISRMKLPPGFEGKKEMILNIILANLFKNSINLLKNID